MRTNQLNTFLLSTAIVTNTLHARIF